MAISEDLDLQIRKKIYFQKSARKLPPIGFLPSAVISVTQQEQILEDISKPSYSRSKPLLIQLSSIVEKHPVLGGAKALGNEARRSPHPAHFEADPPPAGLGGAPETHHNR